VVLTAPTVTFTREEVVEGRRSLFSEHTSGIAVIGGSGYGEDDVNGFVLQQSPDRTEKTMASPLVNVGFVFTNTSIEDTRGCSG
jgi:hypothetical protein